MATMACLHGRIFSLPLLHGRYALLTPKSHHGVGFKQCQPFRGVVRALSSTSTSEAPKSNSGEADATPDGKDGCAMVNVISLACPICHNPLGNNVLNSGRKKLLCGSNLECYTCEKTYNTNEAYLDLTVSSGSDESIDSMPGVNELFRSPTVSFLYERGRRQVLPVFGFPGPEKEFEMANYYLKKTFGGTVIDASCGSGLFSRMFSKSGFYKYVVPLDFSKNMLKQCSEFIKQEGLSTEDIILVRADISRLPFNSRSIDAVHAGAALHCWPSPSAGMAEISRILRPGGVFVGTTLISDGMYPFSLARQEDGSSLVFGRALLRTRAAVDRAFNRATGLHLFASEGELEELCTAAGLVRFTCVRNRYFVMISATKPS